MTEECSNYYWNLMEKFADYFIKDYPERGEYIGEGRYANKSEFDFDIIIENFYNWALDGGVAKEDFYDFAIWFRKEMHRGYIIYGPEYNMVDLFAYILKDKHYIYGYDICIDGTITLIWKEEE